MNSFPARRLNLLNERHGHGIAVVSFGSGPENGGTHCFVPGNCWVFGSPGAGGRHQVGMAGVGFVGGGLVQSDFRHLHAVFVHFGVRGVFGGVLFAPVHHHLCGEAVRNCDAYFDPSAF